MVLETGRYADVTTPFHGVDPDAAQPDFNDIASVVDKFMAIAGAPIKPVAQLQPNIVFPDRPVDFKDIATAVEAFLNTSYRVIHSGPCDCPSAVLCGNTPCADDTHCTGGFCIDGFCRDACGRCQP